MSRILGEITINQGDTIPPFRLRLQDRLGSVVTPVDLTAATAIKVRLLNTWTDTTTEATATVEAPTDGIVTWGPGAECQEPGEYELQVTTTFPSGVRSFPTGGVIRLNVPKKI